MSVYTTKPLVTPKILPWFSPTHWEQTTQCGKPKLTLCKKIFFICYDTRGHGQSIAPNKSYTITELGCDVVGLLEHLHIKKAHFCGISMGGLTGIWLSIHTPDKFDKIIVANTAAKIGNQHA